MTSIRRQLTKNLLLASLLLLGGALVAMYLAAHAALRDQFDDALRAKALAISTLTANEGGEVRLDFTDEFLRGFDDDSPRDFFTLWHRDGTRIARSESLRRRDLPRPEERRKELRFWKFTFEIDLTPRARSGTGLEQIRFWNLKLPNGRPGRAISFVFEPERRGDGGRDVNVELVVAADRRDLNETLYWLGGLAGACGILLLGATVGIVPLVLRRGLRPLSRLGAQAEQINAKSLTARFPTADLPAELRPIAGRLNDLLGRIEQSFERERRFSADLAHELRTPLAELRSLAETALKWPEARDPAVDRDTLAIALQMEALVTSMLTLARGDRDQLAELMEPVALASFVENAWQPFAARAEARGLKVERDLSDATAPADPALLRTVLGNLFDNAVEHSPAGGEVSITLRTEKGRARLVIANTTENLTPADTGRLFERFWRKEEARSGGKHFGLGLSLANTCARAMRWTLDGAIDAAGVIRFTLVSAPSVEGATGDATR
jgi:two-component system sensor histidine kinase QseC